MTAPAKTPTAAAAAIVPHGRPRLCSMIDLPGLRGGAEARLVAGRAEPGRAAVGFAFFFAGIDGSVSLLSAGEGAGDQVVGVGEPLADQSTLGVEGECRIDGLGGVAEQQRGA